ncbi:MAG: FAD-dependent oxidoreductase [Syntrophobacterales bacterium]|nr:FAD-dependent oxidoreductase [Syntrophobacterales bacterium]
MKRRVLIIGAVALGPKVACRLRRLDPVAEIILLDQNEYISYGGCGIPYFISGEVSDIKQLMSTSFHVVRSPQFFRDVKEVEVRTRTRAIDINRRKKEVIVIDLSRGVEESLPYDVLVIATGSKPKKLSVPGADLPGVMTLSNLHDAIAIRDRVSKGEVGSAVIIGAGPIGCEMAEALADLWGIETTVIELMPQILPGLLEPAMANIVKKHMEDHGVTVYTSETVTSIEQENGSYRVVTDKRTLKADLIITAVGVEPNGELARKAGLLVTPRGGIVVNKRLQTSDPSIYAGGDCIEIPHLVTGKLVHFPQGSLANRQGRVIGTNIAGGYAVFEGTVGSFAVKVFELGIASVGISLERAKCEGFDPVCAYVVQPDRAHFYPSQQLMYMALIVDRKTRRILGAQGIGKNGDAVVGRINVVASLIASKATIEVLSNMEMAYTPPFASALDIVNAAANVAENILEGLNVTIDPEEFCSIFLGDAVKPEDLCVLDVRSPANARPYVEKFGPRWVNIPQEELIHKLDNIPKSDELILVCNSGARSYEVLRQLQSKLSRKTRNLQGGVALLKTGGMLTLEESDE